MAKDETSGRTWWLTAYESNEGLCVDFHLGTNASGGCGSGGKAPLLVGGIGFNSALPKYVHVVGQVSSAVASLEMKSGSSTEDVDLHVSKRFKKTFFVVFIPKDVGGRLVARDASGKVLSMHRVPPERDFRPGDSHPFDDR